MTNKSIEFAPDQELKHDLPEHGISAPFLVSVQASFGIVPTRNLVNFTYGACDLSRIVDDCIDYPDRETPETFDDLLQLLEDRAIVGLNEVEADRSLKYVSSLNPEQMDYARKIYLDAVEVTELRSGARNIREYVQAICEEARVQCAALYVSEKPEYNDVEMRKRYNKWLGHLVLAGYLVDSSIDLREDYDEGRTLVMPTRRSRLALAGHALPHAQRALTSMPPKTLYLVGSLFVDMNIKARKQSMKEQEELRSAVA